MAKVLVFGANGLLGSGLCPDLASAGFEVLTAGRSDKLDYTLDVSRVDAVRHLFDVIKPDHVINLIAATNVDQCENDTAMATSVNTLFPGIISDAAASADGKDIHLVHVSTDQVYEGVGDHVEENVRPVNVYGLSKLAGELMVSHEKSVILRTNFIGRSPMSTRVGFSDWLVDAFSKGSDITLFRDVRFSALHTSSLFSIIRKVLGSNLTGTYNVGCRNGISKADFALALAAELGLPTNFARVGTLSDMALKARRPLDMTMNSRKLESALGIECPNMYEEIGKTAKEYANA